MLKSVYTKGLMAAAAIAVSATGFAATVQAQNKTVRTAVVHFEDLDLTSAEGKETLDGRLKGAVRQVCGGYNSRSLADMQDHSNCTNEANLSAKRATVEILAAAEAGKPIETAMVISR
ncbi:UrcA family protein [Parasphingorhabdus sp.]|uniref:UrcA family protein n=1 Tax=Parasphingorhabdus sp. TaxID=2709688 RepID=UPI0032642399